MKEALLRLWQIYQSRIRSNLIDSLRPLMSDPVEAAENMIALIDGLYIRAALSAPEEPQLAVNHAMRVLNTLLEAEK